MDSMYKRIDKKALRDEIIKQKGMVSQTSLRFRNQSAMQFSSQFNPNRTKSGFANKDNGTK